MDSILLKSIISGKKRIEKTEIPFLSKQPNC